MENELAMPHKEKFAKYDAADFLRTPAEIQEYLEIVFEENPDDPAVIAVAIGAAMRAHGVVKTAKETGITREGLYKAFSDTGNPSFANVLKVLRTLGIGLRPEITAQKRPAGKRRKAA